METIAFGVSVVGFGLMLFGIGAQAGWLWAEKSLQVTRPRWITGVIAAAGCCFALAAALQADWLSVLGIGLLFGVVVLAELSIFPLRGSGSGKTA